MLFDFPIMNNGNIIGKTMKVFDNVGGNVTSHGEVNYSNRNVHGLKKFSYYLKYYVNEDDG